MKKQQFIANNRGIDSGKDLDQGFLESLYDSIVANQIAMEHERCVIEIRLCYVERILVNGIFKDGY